MKIPSLAKTIFLVLPLMNIRQYTHIYRAIVKVVVILRGHDARSSKTQHEYTQARYVTDHK